MNRLDCELVQRGLFVTRSKASLAIKEGTIFCDGKQIRKCGYEVNSDTKIEIRGEKMPYVSRGGLKLERALTYWNISLQEKVMLDIGSSTGGFSDCALQHGAKKIYAIDVGSQQFDGKLAQNPKIHLYEKTDFRKMPKEILQDATFASIDVSFISVTKLIEKISELSNIQEIVCLIKPQFECGKEIADKYRGVIKEKAVHQATVQRVKKAFEEIQYTCIGIIESPIKGGDGNTEFLGYFRHLKN